MVKKYVDQWKVGGAPIPKICEGGASKLSAAQRDRCRALI